MQKHSRNLCASLALGVMCILSLSAGASAQATRTWVSGVGDDVNPCSRTAPCKTFAGAYPKTAAGGQINVLDPGGYGGVTIGKSLSVIANGVTAGVLVLGDGVVINAGESDSIYLEGLDFEGESSSASGVRIMQAGKVVIRNSTIRNFRKTSNGAGVDVQSATPVDVLLENVILSNNLKGIYAKSLVSQRILARNSTVFGNTSGGLVVDGKTSTIYNAGSTLFANTPDISRVNGGRVIKTK